MQTIKCELTYEDFAKCMKVVLKRNPRLRRSVFFAKSK